MLNRNEREMLGGFLKFTRREFDNTCRTYAVRPAQIIGKLGLGEMCNQGRKYHGKRKLTMQEQAVISGFLRDQGSNFKAWITTYEVNEKLFFNALKRAAQ